MWGGVQSQNEHQPHAKDLLLFGQKSRVIESSSRLSLIFSENRLPLFPDNALKAEDAKEGEEKYATRGEALWRTLSPTRRGS